MKSALLFSRMLLVALVPGLAAGGTPTTAPEPGTVELLALGGVVALVIGLRSRRRNKK